MNMMQFHSGRAVEDGDGAYISLGLVRTTRDLVADASAEGEDTVPLQMAMAPGVLASALVAAFRAHSHINNVMTHISGARWDHIERALHVILDCDSVSVRLNRLEANIVELICAESGVTGRIVRPYFETQLGRLLPPILATRLQAHVLSLHLAEQSAAGADRYTAPVTGEIDVIGM